MAPSPTLWRRYPLGRARPVRIYSWETCGPSAISHSLRASESLLASPTSPPLNKPAAVDDRLFANQHLSSFAPSLSIVSDPSLSDPCLLSSSRKTWKRLRTSDSHCFVLIDTWSASRCSRPLLRFDVVYCLSERLSGIQSSEEFPRHLQVDNCRVVYRLPFAIDSSAMSETPSVNPQSSKTYKKDVQERLCSLLRQ